MKITHDFNNPDWKNYTSLFTQNEKRRAFRRILFEEYRNMGKDEKPFAETCQDPNFQEEIMLLDVKPEWLTSLTWRELFNSECPGLHELFLRMFRKNTKGISVNSLFDEFNEGVNYILLWSRDKPSFEKNYQDWERDEKEDYIRREYMHMVSELDDWIEEDEEDARISPFTVNARNCLVERFIELKNRFPPVIAPDETFSSLSKKISIIRTSMKQIIETALEQSEGERREKGRLTHL